MILPNNVTQYAETWNGLSAGTARLSSGITTKTAIQHSARIAHPRGPYRRRPDPPVDAFTSRVLRAALEGEHALRPFLDEENDEHQYRDLGEHRALPRLEQLVGKAQ